MVVLCVVAIAWAILANIGWILEYVYRKNIQNATLSEIADAMREVKDNGTRICLNCLYVKLKELYFSEDAEL